MDLNNIIDILQIGGTGVVVILAGLIKIPKIEINFWTYLAQAVGRAINKEMMVKVDKMAKDLEKHIQDEEEKEAKTARQRFLRFNDELLEGKKHTKEHFDEILEDIDDYEDYCANHPLYENSKAELAIANIKRIYNECLEEKKFLG